MAKLVCESLDKFLNEISDEKLKEKIAAAREEGRKISPEYEEKLWAKQEKNKEVQKKKEEELKKKEAEESKRKREEKIEEINKKLKDRTFEYNGPTPREEYSGKSYYRIDYVSNDEIVIELIRLMAYPDPDTPEYPVLRRELSVYINLKHLIKDKQDTPTKILAYNTSLDGKNLIKISELSDTYGLLAQIVKAFFPENKFADRKAWSEL